MIDDALDVNALVCHIEHSHTESSLLVLSIAFLGRGQNHLLAGENIAIEGLVTRGQDTKTSIDGERVDSCEGDEDWARLLACARTSGDRR